MSHTGVGLGQKQNIRSTSKGNVLYTHLDNDDDLRVRGACIHESSKVLGAGKRAFTLHRIAPEANFTLLRYRPPLLGNLTAPFAKPKAVSAQPCMHTDNDQVN